MKTTANRISDTRLYARLLRYVWPYWRIFILSVLAMVVFAATEPGIPALQKPLFDGALIGKDPRMLLLIPVLYVLLFALRGAAGYVSGVTLHSVANKIIMDIREEMFAKLLTFPSAYYDQHTTGSLISKFTFDVTQMKEAATNALTIAVKDSLAIIGLLGLILYLDWRMTLIVLAGAPLIIAVVAVVRRRLRTMSRKTQISMGEINQILREVIDGHFIVKLFGGTQQEAERFHAIANSNRMYNMKFAMASVATGPAIQLIGALGLALIIYAAADRVQSGALSVGGFATFFFAVGLLLGPLKRLVGINEYIQKGLAACESVFGLLDEPAEPDGATAVLSRARGEVEIRALSFRYYPEQPEVLTGISLHIQPGETVALVGASGGGKTTLASLLPRFYQQDTGKILIDGRDIREITLGSLRANLALVSQDIVLFNDTIRNNIAYGASRNASDAAIAAAARAAHALDFIEKQPQGMDTVLGDRGTRLSGGERQRIALARALLKNAPILILDEATSALDTESERQIQLALEELRGKHTCIIIAHRLTTIESADRILVLDQGRIVETGSHKELLEREGFYARYYSKRQ